MFASNTSQVSSDATYIEDVFSTYLYTGNGSTQTITNGIDLAGKGGLVWIKSRSQGANYFDNVFYDTARGVQNALASSGPLATAGTQNNSGGFTGVDLYQFTNSGFSLGTDATFYKNTSADPLYASWTFRKQPKFFDVVTWTGNGVNGRQIAHSLGSVPGCIIVKNTSNSENWAVYHRSNHSGGNDPQNYALYLNTTAGTFGAGFWNNTAPTSTVFTVANDSRVNTSGDTYVAYLFAHNAGGFGLTGTDNVISCGSFTTDGSGAASVTLGYEPQFGIFKATGLAQNWVMQDIMRGATAGPGGGAYLLPNSSAAEATFSSPYGYLGPTATGFNANGLSASQTYIYIAIRRGPMKTPTSGTSVFAPAFNQSATGILAYLGQPTDFWIRNDRTGSDHNVRSRMTGGGYLLSNSTAAEGTQALNWWDNQVGVGVAGTSYGANSNIINYLFRRAPGFFDVVCYTGTGSARTVTHNLGVAPELMIVKQRSGANYWPVYSAAIGNDYILSLDTTGAKDGPGAPQWNNTAPTASVFSLGASSGANASGGTYVAYLFASCPGVSKVGSYTGTGTTKQIDCGFTGGARFVLIKRTDSTGDWYVWDSARGIVAGNDPYLLLNSTAAEVTNTDYVDAYAAGFEISSTAPAAINANGGTFIYLAIA